ncbi:MAG TPA: DUF2254 domain-containing protein [Gammaproteobacteria bacterium]|nr:DUF2254 domain-containing protein [Gammaproteobacteria bacterium]
MKSMLIDGWIRVRGSYWFVPSLMAAAAIALALLLVLVDLRAGIDLQSSFPRWFSNRAESAQALLAAIAGSMITVAGVAFSLTLLAVSHATSQIGHSLLDNFMRDRGNQIALGTFIATFLYCVVVLRSFGLDAGVSATIGTSIPHVATLGAVILSICSVMVLIYFIHHVTQSISVSNVVTRLGNMMLECVQRTYPSFRHDESGNDRGKLRAATAVELPDGFSDKAVCVSQAADDSGYVRVIDIDSLVAIAEEEDLVIDLIRRPGEFVIPGEELAYLQSTKNVTDEICEKIRSVFSTGPDRTHEQDVLLIAEQLIEIAGRALSPGVNNQKTAMHCIDQLGRSLADIFNRDEPRESYCDESGQLRVRCRVVHRSEFYSVVTDALRQYVRGDWAATRHFVRMLRRLPLLTQSEAWADRVASTLEVIRDEAKTSSMPEPQYDEVPWPSSTGSR